MSFKKHYPFLILLTISSLVSLTAFNPLWSDENFYFYISKLVSEGSVLYKDIFFMKPPALIYGLAAFFKIAGPSILTGNFYTFAQKTLTIIILYATGLELEKKYKKKGVALNIALITMTIGTLWRGGAETLGFMQTTFFVALSVYAFIKEKSFWSGLTASLAILTRQDAIILPIAFLLSSRENWKKYLLGLTIPFIITTLYFLPYKNYVLDNLGTSAEFTRLMNWEGMLDAMVSSTSQFFVVENAWLTLLLVFALVYRKKMFYNKFFLLYIGLTLFLEYAVIRAIRFYYLAQLIPVILLFSATNLEFNKRKTFYLGTLAFTLLAVYQFVYVYHYNPIASGDLEIRQDFMNFITANSSPDDMIMGYSTFVSEVAMRTGRDAPPQWVNTFMHVREAGGATAQDFMNAMKRNKIKFFLDRTDEYSLLGIWPELFDFMIENCVPYIKFPHPRGDIAVWKCEWN
ncbi:MAG: hypothetical protein GOU97_04880 [Nanoarchaeota archaeon]|nr:hypothetical protein [Nanoarchaeota archaeon]